MLEKSAYIFNPSPWLSVDKSWVGPLLMHKKLNFIILVKLSQDYSNTALGTI